MFDISEINKQYEKKRIMLLLTYVSYNDTSMWKILNAGTYVILKLQLFKSWQYISDGR